MPSDLYSKSIADYREFHARSSTFTGGQLVQHAAMIEEIVRRRVVRSILDVGCGKGEQYARRLPSGQTLEELWQVPVTRYDPAVPQFAAEPGDGVTFDLVLCTHTICLVPLADLEWFIDRLYGWASRAIYVAEKLGPMKKGATRLPHGDLGVNRDAAWWMTQLAMRQRVGVEVNLTVLERGVGVSCHRLPPRVGSRWSRTQWRALES